MRDVLTVAPELLGKVLVRRSEGREIRAVITEVEAYRGEEDLACHARFGRTTRNGVMYQQGGTIYVYLIYGIYWMLNLVTGVENDPQAVLIRGVNMTVDGKSKNVNGPGKLTQALGIDKRLHGQSVATSQELWVEEGESIVSQQVHNGTRIGIDYAGEWQDKPWRWWLNS